VQVGAALSADWTRPARVAVTLAEFAMIGRQRRGSKESSGVHPEPWCPQRRANYQVRSLDSAKYKQYNRFIA